MPVSALPILGGSAYYLRWLGRRSGSPLALYKVITVHTGLGIKDHADAMRAQASKVKVGAVAPALARVRHGLCLNGVLCVAAATSTIAPAAAAGESKVICLGLANLLQSW